MSAISLRLSLAEIESKVKANGSAACEFLPEREHEVRELLTVETGDRSVTSSESVPLAESISS